MKPQSWCFDFTGNGVDYCTLELLYQRHFVEAFCSLVLGELTSFPGWDFLGSTDVLLRLVLNVFCLITMLSSLRGALTINLQ